MRMLTDPAFLRCKYTSYLLLAGAFLIALCILLKTGMIGPSSPAHAAASTLSSGVAR